MPLIRSLASKYRAHVIVVILLLSEIMPSCFYYNKKKLVCIVIVAPFSRQPSSYFKCIKLNIYLSYNVRSVSDTKYIFISLYDIYNLSQLLGRNTWWYTVFLALYYTY